MPKSDFIPRTDSDFLVWHDQFKTAVLAQAAIPRLRDLVAADTTPITNDNTDPAWRDAKVTSVNSTSAIATQAVADKNTKPSRRGGTNKHARAFARRYGTGANRGNGEGTENLRSLRFLLFKSDSGGVVQLDFDKSISDGVNMNPESFLGYANPEGFRGDFVFLACRAGLPRRNQMEAEVKRRRARDTAPAPPKSDEGWSPYIDNRLPALHRLGGGGREYKAVYVQSDAEIGLFSDEVVVNCAP